MSINKAKKMHISQKGGWIIENKNKNKGKKAHKNYNAFEVFESSREVEENSQPKNIIEEVKETEKIKENNKIKAKIKKNSKKLKKKNKKIENKMKHEIIEDSSEGKF